MFWNCQGISPKRKELELYLTENSIDIIALNETFLNKKYTFKVPCYDSTKRSLNWCKRWCCLPRKTWPSCKQRI